MYFQIYVLLKYTQISIELHIILNFILQRLVSDIVFTSKTCVYDGIFKSVTYLALLRKAADEIRIKIFSYLSE
jgi:hypothetical protein